MSYWMLMIVVGFLGCGVVVSGVEEADFVVLQAEGDFSVRRYETNLLEEVVIEC